VGKASEAHWEIEAMGMGKKEETIMAWSAAARAAAAAARRRKGGGGRKKAPRRLWSDPRKGDSTMVGLRKGEASRYRSSRKEYMKWARIERASGNRKMAAASVRQARNVNYSLVRTRRRIATYGYKF
jgi:hypothetical protein